MTELVLEKMNWNLPQKANMKMEVTDNQNVGHDYGGERHTHLNTEFQRMARRDKKPF